MVRCAKTSYVITYGYDALSRQTSVTDPLTNTVTTAYDAEGRVVSQRGATYPVDDEQRKQKGEATGSDMVTTVNYHSSGSL